MNTGKIMIGFSMILLSLAMTVSPSGATGPQDCCEAGYGIVLHPEETSDPAFMQTGPVIRFIANEPCTNATYPYER